MTREEELDEILNTMDVPQQRRLDFHWLGRNLGVRNSGHPRFERVRTIILNNNSGGKEMITVLSDNELRKATISETKDGFTITHYRRKSDLNNWVFDHAAFSAWPLHLVLNMAVKRVNVAP